MRIRQIGHLAFRCRDLEKSVAFYRDALGLKEKFRLYFGDLIGDDDGHPLAPRRNDTWIAYMELPGGSFIELFDAEGATEFAVPGGAQLNYQHFALVVDDVHALHAELTEKGVEVDVPPKYGIEGTWQMWTHDPDGNKIEWMQYTDSSMQLNGRK